MSPLYTKVLIAAGIAAASASSAWAVQGWRMGQKLAEQQAAHQTKDIRRQAVALTEWNQAAHKSAQELMDAKAKLRAQRLANASLLAKVQEQAAQLGPEFACMDTPLPEAYLERFRK